MSGRITYTLKTIAVVTAALAACFGLAWMLGGFMLSRGLLPSDWLASVRWPLFVWRMMFIAALFFAWPKLCRWYVHRQRIAIEEPKWQALQAYRWRLVALLLVAELVIVQGFPLKFLG